MDFKFDNNKSIYFLTNTIANTLSIYQWLDLLNWSQNDFVTKFKQCIVCDNEKIYFKKDFYLKIYSNLLNTSWSYTANYSMQHTIFYIAYFKAQEIIEYTVDNYGSDLDKSKLNLYLLLS